MPSLRRTLCVLAAAGAPLGSLLGAAAAHATPAPPDPPTIVSPDCPDTGTFCYINQSRPSITVAGVAGATVDLYALTDSGASGPLDEETVAEDGEVNLTPTDDLPNGFNSLIVTQTVGGATSDDSDTLALDVDTSAPVLSNDSDASRTTNTTPSFGVDIAGPDPIGSDGNAMVDLINANTHQVLAHETLSDADTGGSAGLQVSSPLADGTYSVYAVAIDNAGNTGGPSNTVTFTVDTTPPAIPTLTSPANGSIVTTSTPAVTTTGDAAGDTVCADIDESTQSEQVVCQVADANGNATLTPSPALGDGQHTLAVYAYDDLFNVSNATAATTFTVMTGSGPTPTPTPTPTRTPTPSPAPTPGPRPLPAPILAAVPHSTPVVPPRLDIPAGKTLTLTAGHPVEIGIAVSDPGTVTLTLTKKVHGKTVVVGTVKLQVTKPGTVSYTLAGTFAGHTLAKGGYTLSLQSASGGRHSKKVRVPLHIGGKH